MSNEFELNIGSVKNTAAIVSSMEDILESDWVGSASEELSNALDTWKESRNRLYANKESSLEDLNMELFSQLNSDTVSTQIKDKIINNLSYENILRMIKDMSAKDKVEILSGLKYEKFEEVVNDLSDEEIKLLIDSMDESKILEYINNFADENNKFIQAAQIQALRNGFPLDASLSNDELWEKYLSNPTVMGITCYKLDGKLPLTGAQKEGLAPYIPTASEEITGETMNYGANIDVTLKDSEGNIHYLNARVGDSKAHTWPNGIFQTGYAFPDGIDYHDTGGGAPVEFIGKWIKEEGLNEYEIVDIIVYD